MSKAFIVSSGSEAMEAAIKLSRQFFLEQTPAQRTRYRFISRSRSYHGITLGALSIGGHAGRRANFEPMMCNNTSVVSPCFSYRGQASHETDALYVARLAKELEDEFIRLGPQTVCAFVAEPVVGAALGCVPAVPGYFKAMKAVCEKYGALLILDEVMCGMGRTGTLHAWQDEGVAPDLQTIGKGLGGGYRPVAGLLISRRIVDVLENGSGIFVHGHTYQAHLSACAAALEVQRIVVSDNLLENVRDKGSRLSRQLRSNLDSHAHVGDIRGKGLFWGVEFVFDRRTKDPFPRHAQIAARLSDLALTEPYGITVYPGAGTVDGYSGDHIILAPPYTITDSDVDLLVESVTKLIRHFFHYEINLPEKSRDS